MLVIVFIFSGCASPVADTATQPVTIPQMSSTSGKPTPETQNMPAHLPVVAKQSVLYGDIRRLNDPIWASDTRVFFFTQSFSTEVIFEMSFSNYDFQTDVLHKHFLYSKDISPANQERSAYLHGISGTPLMLPGNGSYAITYGIPGNKPPESLADIPVNYGTDALTPGYGDYLEYLYIQAFSLENDSLIKEYLYPIAYNFEPGPISVYGDYFPNSSRRDAVPAIIRNLLSPDMPDRKLAEKAGCTVIEPSHAWSPSGEYLIVWNADAFNSKDYLINIMDGNKPEFYQYEVFTRDMTHLSTIILPFNNMHGNIALWEDGRNYIFPNKTYLEYCEYPIWNDGDRLLLHWSDDGSTTRRFTIDGKDITDSTHYGYFVKTLPDAPGQLWYREKDGSVRMVVENLCPPYTREISFNPSLTICLWSAYSVGTFDSYRDYGENNSMCGFTDLRGIIGNAP